MTRVVSPRFGISYPNASLRDEPADVPGDIKKVVDQVDGLGAMFVQNVIGSRPTAGITGRFFWATDQGLIYYDDGANWQLTDGNLFLTDSQFDAITGGTHDGQRIAVHFSATDFMWDLIWDSGASPFKWRCVGSTPQTHDVTTSESTASSSYVDLTTVGPTITVPFAGIYDIEFGVSISTDAANHGGQVSPKLAGATAADVDSVSLNNVGNAVTSSVSRIVHAKTLAKSDVVKLQYKAVGGGTATFTRRWMRLIPKLTAN